MRVCGVIAEYDPFHKGHAYHLQAAREKTQADFVVCVMSGCFTQRGAPALLWPHDRAEMALRCGADLALGLPYAFSVREAEFFALGGVFILQALGCVTHLSFGCELADMTPLRAAAALLEAPDAPFQSALRKGLDRGLSHADALGRALSERLGIARETLNAPNTALALSYLRALLRLNSPILPAPILRLSAYHAQELADISSATALRGAILRGDWPGIARAVPEAALPVLQKALAEGRFCPPESLTPLLRHTLLLSTPAQIAALPGVDEGLESRILRAAEGTVSREALIARIKTRRYTQGRISRALCHALLRAEQGDLPDFPAYARILGFREGARPLLRRMQKSGFPLVSRPAREREMALDIRADELWRIGAGLPRGETYRQSPVILP